MDKARFVVRASLPDNAELPDEQKIISTLLGLFAFFGFRDIDIQISQPAKNKRLGIIPIKSSKGTTPPRHP